MSVLFHSRRIPVPRLRPRSRPRKHNGGRTTDHDTIGLDIGYPSVGASAGSTFDVLERGLAQVRVGLRVKRAGQEGDLT